MNKKVGIGIGIFATVGIVGGLLGWWLSRSEPVDLGKDFSEQPNLEILETTVEDLIVKNQEVLGVITEDDIQIFSKKVILTTI